MPAPAVALPVEPVDESRVVAPSTAKSPMAQSPNAAPSVPANLDPTDAAEARLARFLGHVQTSVMRQTSFASAAWMGGVVGTMAAMVAGATSPLALGIFSGVGVLGGMVFEQGLEKYTAPAVHRMRVAVDDGVRRVYNGIRRVLGKGPDNGPPAHVEAGGYGALPGIALQGGRVALAGSQMRFEGLVPGSVMHMSSSNIQSLQGWVNHSVFMPQLNNAGVAVSLSAEKLAYTLELGASLVGPLLIHRGARLYELGLNEQHRGKQFDGKMRLAAGLLSFSRAGIAAGLGVSLMEWIMARRVRSGRLSIDKANQYANRMLVAAIGPAGLSAAAMAEGLQRRGFHIDLEPPRPEDVKVRRGELLSGALVNAVGAIGGYFAGAMLGGAVGGAVGAMVGAALGRMAGVGLSVSLYDGAQAIKYRRKGLLTNDDLKLLGKVGGGAYAGGFLGWTGGMALGTAVGAGVAALTGAGWISGGAMVISELGAAFTLSMLGARLAARVATRASGGALRNPQAAG